VSRLDRALGLARSLAIYHAIPGRQRRLRRLYAGFVAAGDLAFDVGAHVGNRTRALAALGCRVVALEPQPDFARLMRSIFARQPSVTVIEAACGAAPGRASLNVSERTPTVTTLADGWRAARAAESDFAGVTWNRTLDVEVTTLAALSARFGAPAFVKIDVEGAEAQVLAGLDAAPPALSFEYLPASRDATASCLARLAELGRWRFNWSQGESFAFAEPAWLDAEGLLRALGRARRSGDVYAKRA